MSKMPKGIELRGRGIRISYMVRGVLTRKALDLPQTDFGIAEAVAIRRESIARARAGAGFTDGGIPDPKFSDLRGYYHAIFKDAKKRALGRGQEYRLAQRDEDGLIERSDGRCCLTGIAFNLDRLGARRRPYAPSLDRIDATQGYVPGNVRIVCVAANYAMNEWGEKVLAQVASGYVRTVLLRPFEAPNLTRK